MQARDPLLVAALRIHRRLSESARPVSDRLLGKMEEFLDNQDLFTRTWNQMQMAQRRGWDLSARRLLEQASHHLAVVYRSTGEVQGLMDVPRPAAPSAMSLVQELQQLDQEFGDLQIDLKKHLLLVRTEDIELEDVFLGSFAIQLDWNRIASHPSSDSFDCVALDPHPASKNESVTHPHVQDGKLCAGDAAAVQRQLKSTSDDN